MRNELKEARETSVSTRKDMLSISAAVVDTPDTPDEETSSAFELPDVFKADPNSPSPTTASEEEGEEEEEEDIFDIVGEGANGLGQRKRDMERRLSVASVSDSVGSGGGESVNNNFDDWYVSKPLHYIIITYNI